MKKSMLIFSALWLMLAISAQAQIPRTLSYQGVLADSTTGEGRNGQFSFTFRLYDSASGRTKLWEEKKNLAVTNGLFSTLLGDIEPFGSTVRFDKQYWLGIQVGNGPVLSPRIPLTSVGYSMSSARADTAMVSITSVGDTTWQMNGSDVYRLTGNVGIGTIPLPASKFSIRGKNLVGSPSVAGSILHLETSGAQGAIDFGKLDEAGTSFITSVRAGGVSSIVLNPEGGNVGIGMTPPGAIKLAVRAEGFVGNPSVGGSILHLETSGAQGAIDFGKLDGAGTSFIQSGGTGGSRSIVLNPEGGNVGIGTANPTSSLDINGTTTTKVLAITGGSDLAEPFEISNDALLYPGTVVVIDPDNPGKLKQATEPYDKRVAGIISGAGGINPGLTLMQEGLLDGGQHVALMGKVYALASACNGTIEPGDLLTTSEVPGHVMKATDKERWDGAIIGKAMSKLAQGEGLVLVLVNLQ